MKNVIITGSTGMVGKGVLLECLESPEIDRILIINRSPIGMSHPKLTELLLTDFLQIAELKDQLQGYDACCYCMGISAVGLDEEKYTRITYNTTKAFADVLYSLHPDTVFIYVSGAGTDSSGQGRLMWARVKGRTENMILNKGFKDAYAFRPGFILPEKGIKSRTSWYNTIYFIMQPFFFLLKGLNSVTTTTKIGQAMINILQKPAEKKILGNSEINRVAGQ